MQHFYMSSERDSYRRMWLLITFHDGESWSYRNKSGNASSRSERPNVSHQKDLHLQCLNMNVNKGNFSQLQALYILHPKCDKPDDLTNADMKSGKI